MNCRRDKGPREGDTARDTGIWLGTSETSLEHIAGTIERRDGSENRKDTNNARHQEGDACDEHSCSSE